MATTPIVGILSAVPIILPLNKLIQHDGNRYELAVATMRRAHQLSISADDEVDSNKGKVVSTAVKQIVTKKVKYQVGK